MKLKEKIKLTENKNKKAIDNIFLFFDIVSENSNSYGIAPFNWPNVESYFKLASDSLHFLIKTLNGQYKESTGQIYDTLYSIKNFKYGSFEFRWKKVLISINDAKIALSMIAAYLENEAFEEDIKNKSNHEKLLESISKAKKVIKEMARPVFNLQPNEEVIEKHGAAILINKEKLTAKGYSGNRSKPDFHYRFKNEAQLNDYVEKYFQKIEKNIADKIERRDRNKIKAKEIVDSTQIGDIFYTSWGYEQTNSEFYQVVDKKGSSLFVREIAQDLKHSEGMHSMSGHVLPKKDNFISKEIVVNVRGPYPSVGRQTIYKWDGRPMYVSWYA